MVVLSLCLSACHDWEKSISIFFKSSKKSNGLSVKSTLPIDKMAFTPIGRFDLVSNLPQCSLVKKLQWLPTPGLHRAGQGSVFPRNINAANADLDVDQGRHYYGIKN